MANEDLMFLPKFRSEQDALVRQVLKPNLEIQMPKIKDVKRFY
jgi:hypothetical protein